MLNSNLIWAVARRLKRALGTDDIFREGKLLVRKPFDSDALNYQHFPSVSMCMVLDDSPRKNYVTSLIIFYLRLGLLRRFWRRTERTLECSKCSVEYLQHFCYVLQLRFATTLRFTLWFVHKTFEVVKSVPVISINKVCKKILRIQISYHRDSAIRIWLFF